LSSAGKRTARFLLAGACDSYVSCVHCVARVTLDGNPALFEQSLHSGLGL